MPENSVFKDAYSTPTDKLLSKVSVLESKIDNLNDKIDTEVRHLNDKIDIEVKNLSDKIDNSQKWTIAYIAGIVAVATAILKFFPA
ncbi:hypothetical protein F4X10_22265 [Candidatus Poribacteria bacterium]|nr:hypothetical protein [Candidatus Poribacteria bacterium]